MKQLLSLALAGVLALGLAGCAAPQSPAATAETAATVTLTALDGARQPVTVELPSNPRRIAVLDMAALDILDALGVGDRVVGCADTSLDYLQAYQGGAVANLGTIKEADLEAVMACAPEVIFIGGRLASSYDALSEIAPVVFLSTDTGLGVVESVRRNAAAIGSLFGREAEAAARMEALDRRVEALRTAAAGSTAVVGLCTSGGYNVVGPDGRCSLITREIGLVNVGARETGTATHGSEASFEFLLEKNPDYLFVLDRDAAVGVQGADLARDIMENQLVMATDAYRNGRLVYLDHPAVWYTAEGGLTALDRMLSDLEGALLPG